MPRVFYFPISPGKYFLYNLNVKKTILIFGVSSFVGSNLAQVFAKEYRVIGTFHKNPVNIPGVLTLSCDVLNKNKIQQIVYTFKPDYTFYCVGMSSLWDCKDQPKAADTLNTVGVFNVTTYTERYSSKFVYISTNYVFTGEEIAYTESDSPMPCCVYGNTVAQSEFYIQKSCLNYLILRTCPLYGRTANPRTLNWFEKLETIAYEKRKLICDDHVYTGYLDVQLFVFIIKNCIEKNVTNRLVQISSTDIYTRYQFAAKYAEIFNQNKSLFVKGTWDFPLETSIFSLNNMDENLYFKMDTMNIQRSAGIAMPTIEESLQFTKRRLASRVKKAGKDNKSSGINYI